MGGRELAADEDEHLPPQASIQLILTVTIFEGSTGTKKKTKTYTTEINQLHTAHKIDAIYDYIRPPV